MKKKMAILTAGLLVVGASSAAMADNTVDSTLTKTTNVAVDEGVDINKEVYLNIQQLAKPTNSAEAKAIKNDKNESNTVAEEPTTTENSAAPKSATVNNATIDGASGNGATGVVNVNQSPGNLNNQGNATSIGYSATGDAFLHSESSADLSNSGNSLESQIPEKTDTIDGSLAGASGIISVNQSAGHMNNQDNGTSLAVGVGSIAALSEADLGMYNADNTSHEVGSTKTDILTNGALGTTSGIINVSQSSGSMNNQANVVSAAMLVFP